jgi:peptidoglycan/xylan/chitin deacetylase (PgdA/CDA1 family)
MNQTTVPILLYHALDKDHSVVAVREAVFARQMKWLCDQGLQGISAGTILQCLLNDEPLPARAVGITFDDGFESVYTRAFPILERYGFSATVFLVTGHCGGQNNWPAQPLDIPCMPLMSWAQIEELDRCGIEFGAHTIGHPRLDQLSLSDLARELRDPKVQIEERLGHAIETFAYPYGRYNETVRELVGSIYKGAYSARPGMVTENSDPLELARIDFAYVSPDWVFRQLTNPLFPTYVNMRLVLRTLASAVLRRPWQ